MNRSNIGMYTKCARRNRNRKRQTLDEKKEKKRTERDSFF